MCDLQRANKGSKVIERLRKKLSEQESLLLLTSPSMALRVHNRNGKVSPVFLVIIINNKGSSPSSLFIIIVNHIIIFDRLYVSVSYLSVCCVSGLHVPDVIRLRAGRVEGDDPGTAEEM